MNNNKNIVKVTLQCTLETVQVLYVESDPLYCLLIINTRKLAAVMWHITDSGLNLLVQPQTGTPAC